MAVRVQVEGQRAAREDAPASPEDLQQRGHHPRGEAPRPLREAERAAPPQGPRAPEDDPPRAEGRGADGRLDAAGAARGCREPLARALLLLAVLRLRRGRPRLRGRLDARPAASPRLDDGRLDARARRLRRGARVRRTAGRARGAPRPAAARALRRSSRSAAAALGALVGPARRAPRGRRTSRWRPAPRRRCVRALLRAVVAGAGRRARRVPPRSDAPRARARVGAGPGPRARAARAVLYGVNTLGAVAGALGTGFFAIEALGVDGTLASSRPRLGGRVGARRRRPRAAQAARPRAGAAARATSAAARPTWAVPLAAFLCGFVGARRRGRRLPRPRRSSSRASPSRSPRCSATFVAGPRAGSLAARAARLARARPPERGARRAPPPGGGRALARVGRWSSARARRRCCGTCGAWPTRAPRTPATSSRACASSRSSASARPASRCRRSLLGADVPSACAGREARGRRPGARRRPRVPRGTASARSRRPPRSRSSPIPAARRPRRPWLAVGVLRAPAGSARAPRSARGLGRVARAARVGPSRRASPSWRSRRASPWTSTTDACSRETHVLRSDPRRASSSPSRTDAVTTASVDRDRRRRPRSSTPTTSPPRRRAAHYRYMRMLGPPAGAPRAASRRTRW